MFDRLLSRPIYLALFVAVIAFVVYLQTLDPSVDFIDAGELATDCATLGICHPTGYPVFTLIGWVFAHLPIASTVILRMNLMAAFFTALGAGGVVLLATEIYSYWMPERKKVVVKAQAAKGKSKNVKGNPQKGKVKNQAPESHAPQQVPLREEAKSNTPVLLGFATGIAAAFSSTWWSQSCSIEVYPVHLFFVPIVLTFFLRMLRNEDTEKLGIDGKFFALALGLSFANHMTTVLLAPACLYMFFARYKFSNLAWRRIARLTPFFLAGLAVYIYMPIRSAMYPIMDWGHPTTLGAFLRHVTGGQYKIWMFSSTGAAAKQWAYFWHRVPQEFTIVGGVLALLGIWNMFNSGKMLRTHILAFTLLLFFGCLFYSINYDIHDIDSYFLLAFLAVALWVGAGIWFVSKSLSGMKKEFVIIAAAVILGAIEIGFNYSEVDDSGNWMVEDYTKNILTNLPPNSIIFSTQWDFWVSGAFYFQTIEHLRPDVLVIDKAMLRDRPWYYSELVQRKPEVMNKAKAEMDEFLRYLRAFDNGDKFDESAIAPAYEKFTSALVDRNIDRPIFVTQEMIDERDDLFAPNMKFNPSGVAYRLWPRDTIFNVAPPVLHWRDKTYRKRDYYTDDSRLLQAIPLASYAEQRLHLNDVQSAKQFLDDALLFTPDLEANIDDLGDRDKSIATAADEKFEQIQSLRKQLGK